MLDEAGKKTGRPENALPSETIVLKNVDPVTMRMIESLKAYGRFGTSRPAVALFIIRTWLMEREDYLKQAIAAREAPLGPINLIPEGDE